MSGTDPIGRLYLRRNCADNHIELSDRLIRWLGREGYHAEHVIAIERIRRENPDVYRQFVISTGDKTSRRILAALVGNRGTATYSELDTVTGVSRDTIKRRLKPLRDAGAIEVSASRPPVVSFATEAAEVLASDALSYYDIDNEIKNATTPSQTTHNSDTTHPPNWADSAHLAETVARDTDEDRGTDEKDEDGGGVEADDGSSDGEAEADADPPTETDPYGDPYAHVEIGDPGHPVEFSRGGDS